MMLSVRILKNHYMDSVSLMLMSSNANKIDGVTEVIVAMATNMNKEVMQNVGLFNDDIKNAMTSDMVISAKIKDGFVGEDILNQIEAMLYEKKEINDDATSNITYKTIESAVENNSNANLALISVNGAYAAREAFQALNNGLNVMMFSDNVSVQAEKELKQLAHKNGLLMMGPDCGTAIINGVGLGFANKVRSGNIGVIAASGTGSQEISVRIHEFGGGISQLIGTGGRDLSLEIGGITMLDAMDMFEADPKTEVIVLVSKPADQAIEKHIVEKAESLSKPVVIWFVGGNKTTSKGQVYFETMSKNAAIKAIELSGIDLTNVNKKPLNLPLIEQIQKEFGSEQKYIRGLFAGGTLCAEAIAITEEMFDNVYSNITKNPDHKLLDLYTSKENTFIDFGSDEYTDGKPHPMIDPSNRIERFLQEAKDPNVGVIVLDFVLGYGAHPDPVGMMVPYIEKALDNAKAEGRSLEILGYVLGTDLDSQNLEQQVQKLTDAGAIHASSSQNTGLLARGFINNHQ